MATQTTASCTGSTLLQPISEIINLPLDQVQLLRSSACLNKNLMMMMMVYCHHQKASSQATMELMSFVS
ncbi:hypothetical protein ATANTOWER_017494 [Ataeniobius toweri]|uniref:Uncharacterized protein n=1 Tax=Ataeniobius toweri TaxID=208326 RepID=A0ABU7BZU2_9TELE|nr:hypothetical protein [Ataeniobius toweri]